MANPQNLKAPWKPGQSGNPKGRPKDEAGLAVKTLFGMKRRKELQGGLTPSQIDGWEQTLLQLTSAETALLVKWDACPNYPKGLAMAILYDMKNGRTTTLDKLRERQYGKPKQTIELTGKDGVPLMPDAKPLTPEQAKEFIRKLEDDY